MRCPRRAEGLTPPVSRPPSTPGGGADLLRISRVLTGPRCAHPARHVPPPPPRRARRPPPLDLLGHGGAFAGPRPRLRGRPGDHAPHARRPGRARPDHRHRPDRGRGRPAGPGDGRALRARAGGLRARRGGVRRSDPELQRRPPGHERGARSRQVRPGGLRRDAPSGDARAAARPVHQDLRRPAMTIDPISLLKGRMAEALVEAVFKRARYTVARVGRETQMPAPVRSGHTDFIPDFMVWRALDGPSLGHHSYRLVAIEVRYRADLEDYLCRDSPSRSAEVAQQWPELYEILVTDRPECARACFQAIHASPLYTGTVPGTLDLHKLPALDIDAPTLEEYEGLVREIFPILGSQHGSRQGLDQAHVEPERKPRAWMPGRSRGRGHRLTRPARDPHRYRPSVASEHRPGVSEERSPDVSTTLAT